MSTAGTPWTAALRASVARHASVVAVVLVALLFALPFLVPVHRYPLTTFDSEWVTALLLAAALLVAAISNRAQITLSWPLPAVALLLGAVATGQYLLGRLQYTYGLASLGLFMCAFFSGYLLARWLVATGLRQAALRAAGVALLAAGLYSVAAQMVQVLDIRTLPTWLVVPIVETVSARRPYANLAQPNHLATYLAWATLAAMYLARRRVPQPPLLLAAAVTFCGLALTGSRMGSLFAVLLIVLAATPNSLSEASWRPRARWIVALVLGYAAGLAMAKTLLIDPSGSMATALGRFGASLGERGAMWADAWRIAWAHPWLGVGFGEYGGAQYLAAQPAEHLVGTSNPHNVVLHLAAEFGWPAAAFVLAAAGSWCWKRASSFTRDADATFALLLIVLVLVHSLLEYPLWHLYFLVPVALLAGLGEPDAVSPSMRPLRARLVFAPIAVASLCTVAVMKADFESVAATWDAYLRERMAGTGHGPQVTGEVLISLGATYFVPQMERAYIELLPVQALQGDENIELSWRVLTRLPGEALITRHILLLLQAGRIEESYLHIARLKVFAGVRYPEFREAIEDAIAQNEAALDPVRQRLREP